MAREPYEQRVVEEQEALTDKIYKLKVFMNGSLFEGLDVADKGLLCQQVDLMEQYEKVLLYRIARFK